MSNKNTKPKLQNTRRRTVSPSAADPPPRDDSPDRGEIARLAYSYWEQRGCKGGSPEEDWLRAENELKARASGGK